MSNKRYIDNPFDDYSPVNDVFEQTSGLLNINTKDNLLLSINKLLTHLESNLSESIDPKDESIYTGSTGFALLYLHLYRVFDYKKYLDKSLEIVDLIVNKLSLKKNDISFVLGNSGVLSIAALIHHINGDQNGCHKLLTSLKSMVKFCTDSSSQTPDEILYGRSGFLYSLLFVRKYIGNSQQIIDNNDIRLIVDAIIKSGQKTAQKDKIADKCPLMYYWYNTPYLGAAHGVMGIMAVLLEAKSYLTDNELNHIKKTIDFILTLRLPSGNYPSALDDMSDVLVHWCHGSPGAVHLFALAYRVFNEDKYLMAAKDCCECIWKRGLLTKGYGLCHGVAGNGYAFLRLYQLTNDVKYYYRAVKFGLWCGRYGEHGCRTPDRPFSLFEGMAGTIYYLSDLLKPEESLFPAYQLSI
ncbi:glutathione S-transferase LANCL1-like [Oppia nitens]|uniref:glutathione S-transferase LANCL1-like n=1 Tax=Oppia nitens TaxID=1686743 RepID=UPI0023DB79A9|nr:glutathione S-transferase LANCL1-like [Oppia nitens]